MIKNIQNHQKSFKNIEKDKYRSEFEKSYQIF